MAKAKDLKAEIPLIIQKHQLIQALIRTTDEDHFIFERQEGAILYNDFMKPKKDRALLVKALQDDPDRFIRIPQLTLYEKKAIISGYMDHGKCNEDTKSKISELISSARAPEELWAAIKDSPTVVESWTQYFMQQMTVWCTNFLREKKVFFAFEEDFMKDYPVTVIDQYKEAQFTTGKVATAVKQLRTAAIAKARVYSENIASLPKARRGRPPKGDKKAEANEEFSTPYYRKIGSLSTFLYTPDISQLVPILYASSSETIGGQGSALRGATSDTVSTQIQTLSARLDHLQKKMKIAVPKPQEQEAPPKTLDAIKKKPSKNVVVKDELKGLMGVFKGAFKKSSAEEKTPTKTKKVAQVKRKKD